MRKKLEAIEHVSDGKGSIVSKSSHDASVIENAISQKFQSRFSMSNDKRNQMEAFKSASAGKHFSDTKLTHKKPEITMGAVYDSHKSNFVLSNDSKAGRDSGSMLGKRLLDQIKNSVLQEKRGSSNLPVEPPVKAIQIDVDEGKPQEPAKKKRGRKPKNKAIDHQSKNENNMKNIVSTRRSNKRAQGDELVEGEEPIKKLKN